MLVGFCARLASFVFSLFVATAFVVAGCSSDSEATQDGGLDSGTDAGPRDPGCANADDCDDGDPCSSDLCDPGLGCIHELIDGDDDGYAEAACTTNAWNGRDCKDDDATVYPGAPELCDQLDNDCDEIVDDETVEVPCARDADQDGYGLMNDTVRSCNCPDGYIPPRSDGKFDCFDEDADVNPGHTEFTAPGYCPVEPCAFPQLEYDFDCNGEEEEQYPTSSDGACRFENVRGIPVCRGSGWVLNVPFCGDSGDYRSCDPLDGCSETIIDSRRQGCR